MTSLPKNLQLHGEDLDECDLSSEEESVPEDSVQGPSSRFVERGKQKKDSARAPENQNDKDESKNKNKKENQNQNQNENKGEQLPAEPTGTTIKKRMTDKQPPSLNPNKYNVPDDPKAPEQSLRGCIIM